MAKGFTIDVRGLDKALANIDKKSKDIKNKIGGILEDEVNQINEEQIILAPIDKGTLRLLTDKERDGDLQFRLFSEAEYAPYMEFGTGGSVLIPPGLENYAAQFKGKGIREVNLPAQPYFFPPFFSHKAKMIERIKKVL